MSCLWKKKERAFWIWVDGLALDQLELLRDQTALNSVSIRVYPPE